MKYLIRIILFVLLFSCGVSTVKEAPSSVKSESDEIANQEESVVLTELRSTDNVEDILALCGRSADTTYLINFWATWCKPCVEELPYFFELEEKRKDTPFKLILVSLDFNENALTKFLEEKEISTENWHFTNMKYNDWIDKIDPSWSGSIPASMRCDSEAGNKFAERSFHSYDEIYQWAVKN